jgi:hypothetical protein
MKIAYAMNRTEKQMRAAGVVADKYYMDNDMSCLQERLDMVKAVAPGVTVEVLTMADLGRGRAQLKAVRSIEAAGGKIVVVGDGAPAGAGGRPQADKWPSDEALTDALVIWDALPAPEALKLIKRNYGVETTRNRMNHQRKKRAAAKLAQQEFTMSEKQKLIDRLCNDPSKTLVKFGVSKGEGWNAATPEERAAAINKCLDAVDEGKSTPLNFNDSQRKS